MRAKLQNRIPVTPETLRWQSLLDELIAMDGTVRPMPAGFYASVPRDALQMWASLNAVWVFPTEELIHWLRNAVGGVVSIEIGAGNGGIAKALGIPATDSWVQVYDAPTRAAIESAGQTISHPGETVERLEAMEAIERYKPHTVIGAYVTHRWQPGDVNGFVFGVDEERLLQRVSRYIVIGNDAPHGGKRIMARPHRTIRAPWLVTRAISPERNAIYVWEGEG